MSAHSFSMHSHSFPAAFPSQPTRAERLRAIWNKTTSVRLAVGAILFAGGVMAAASGAFAVAGGIVAVRAGIAGTGAFLISDAILRSAGFEKNATAVSLGVGIAVAAILAIPAVTAAEFANIPAISPSPALPSDPLSVTPPSPIGVLGASPSEILTPETVREIFADIRADHPGQGYVTIEQSVRRIE